LLDINVIKNVYSTLQQIDPARNLKKWKEQVSACLLLAKTKDERKLQYSRSNIHSPAEKVEHHYYLKIYRRGMWLLFFNQPFETF
jgi:hypothetical protein